MEKMPWVRMGEHTTNGVMFGQSYEERSRRLSTGGEDSSYAAYYNAPL